MGKQYPFSHKNSTPSTQTVTEYFNSLLQLTVNVSTRTNVNKRQKITGMIHYARNHTDEFTYSQANGFPFGNIC